MSVARVKTSAFAARKGKTLKCQRCQREIAKGETYRWWFKGFRSRFKYVRCMTCPAPRMSELESSNLAEAYAAQETAEDALDALTEDCSASDIDSIVSDMADAIEEVASTYREADEAFGGQGATVSAERADELDNAVGELQDFQAEEFDEDDPHCEKHDEQVSPCEDCDAAIADARQDWFNEQVDAARDVVTGVSF